MDDPSILSTGSRLKFLLKDSALYGLATALNRAFGLISFPLLARYFSVADYGTIDFFVVFSSFLATSFVFGQDSAIARYFYEYKDVEIRKQIISQSFSLQLATIFMFIPLLWMFSDSVALLISSSPQSQELFKLNLLQVPFLVLINFSQNILKWTFSRKYFLIISLGSVISYVVLLMLALGFYAVGVEGVFVVLLLNQAIFGLLSLYFVRDWLVVPRGVDFLWQLIVFAIPYGVICAISSFMPTLERSLVSSYLGPHDLGLYAAGGKVAMLIAFVVQAFQTAWGPFSLAIHKEEDAVKTYNSVLKVFSLVICFSVLVLSALSEIFINLLATGKYSGASIVVFPLAMGLAIQSIGWITEIGIGLSKKSFLSLYSYAAFVVSTCIGIYIFAAPFGLLGIALGVLIGYLCKALASSYLSFRIFPLNWDFMPVLFLVSAFLIFGLVVSFLSTVFSPYVASVIYASGAIILPIAGWHLLWEKNEREHAASFLKKYFVS